MATTGKTTPEQLLNSQNPEKRREGIHAIGSSSDFKSNAALRRMLHTVAQRDPSYELRALAEYYLENYPENYPENHPETPTPPSSTLPPASTATVPPVQAQPAEHTTPAQERAAIFSSRVFILHEANRGYIRGREERPKHWKKQERWSIYGVGVLIIAGLGLIGFSIYQMSAQKMIDPGLLVGAPLLNLIAWGAAWALASDFDKRDKLFKRAVLLRGEITGSGTTRDEDGHIRYTLHYAFTTPQGKALSGELGTYSNRAFPKAGTDCAILYFNDERFELL